MNDDDEKNIRMKNNRRKIIYNENHYFLNHLNGFSLS